MPLDNSDGEVEASVRLPSAIKTMDASRRRVGIITTSEEVLIWTIGEGLKPLTTSNYPRNFTGVIDATPMGLRFHPDNQDHVFVAFSTITPTATSIKILIQEHKNGQPTVFHPFEIFTDGRFAKLHKQISNLEDGCFGFKMIDSVNTFHPLNYLYTNLALSR
jgi:hypothetical protein